MAVEDWIDKVVDRWATIVDPKGGNLTAFRVYDKANFPEAISKDNYPCAITFIESMSGQYGQSESLEYWLGVTEFHLVPDVGKHHYSYIMRWFKLIRDAAIGAVQLVGSVSNFALRVEGIASIEGPVVLQYGEEAPHLGLIARWQVKEDVTAEATLTA